MLAIGQGRPFRSARPAGPQTLRQTGSRPAAVPAANPRLTGQRMSRRGRYTSLVISASDRLRRARLVLFDIDGTLLGNGNGVHARSIIAAGTELSGRDIALHFPEIIAGGRTDRYIVCELLRLAGVAPDEVDDLFAEIAIRSIELTRVGLVGPQADWALPGATTLLSALMTDGVPLGLVTGNLPEIARLKLECAEIWKPFASQNPLITGYGDISEDRNDLTRAALRDARLMIDPGIEGSDVVIVGDTPRDVECAHAIGATCVAVATGRFTAEQLASAGADHIVGSLTDI